MKWPELEPDIVQKIESQPTVNRELLEEAAKKIKKLRDILKGMDELFRASCEENEKLRAALKPFLIETRPEHNVYGYKMVFVKPEDLRAAAAALKENGDD